MLKTDRPLALSPVWLEARVAAAGTPLRVQDPVRVAVPARQCLP